jgi:CMP-N-acetylneuraminic acid synthetase
MGPDKALGEEMLLYILPVENSLDIESELDFRVAEVMMNG